MTEPIGTDGVTDPQVALEREVDALSRRFPEVPRTEVEERVHHAYDDLHREARIRSHLIALTSARVTDDLIHIRHAA